MSYIPKMNVDFKKKKKSVKYCNLFINILFTQPHRKAINNSDTCKSEMMGELWRVAYPYQLVIYCSGLSIFIFVRRPILHSAPLFAYTVRGHSNSAPTGENTDARKLRRPHGDLN